MKLQIKNERKRDEWMNEADETKDKGGKKKGNIESRERKQKKKKNEAKKNKVTD